MYAELPSHEMSLMLINTGDQRLVRPSIGSWLTWGMGSENENLPGFVALCPGGLPVGGAGNWRSAFLPGVFQGTHIDTSNTDPLKIIENIRNSRLTPGPAKSTIRPASIDQRSAPRRATWRIRHRGSSPLV